MHEGKTLEFKRDMSSPEGILRTVCAFANSAGGTLLIGIEDKTRRIVGLDDPLAAEERLVNLVADSIRPQLVPQVEIAAWRNRQILIVTVFPGGVRPCFLKSLGQHAGTFVRIGSSNRLASSETIADLKRSSANVTFDEEPMPDLGTDAIDFAAAVAAFAGHRRLRRSDLKTLRLLTRYAGKDVPTVGGVLLFGCDRLDHFPDAWLHAACFQGTDRTEILDMSELRSSLPSVVDEALAFVRRNSARRVVIREARREEHPTFPPVAVREAVINAIVHADYSQRGSPIRVAVFADRLEVENPGLLTHGLSFDDIRQGISKLRNRMIGRVFHELGLIEQWGSGIQRMCSACRTAGLPEPEFEEIAERFRVTLRTQRARKTVSRASSDDAILRVLSDGKAATTAGIARAIGLSTRTVRLRLERFVDEGLVVEIGTGPNDPKRSYRLAK